MTDEKKARLEVLKANEDRTEEESVELEALEKEVSSEVPPVDETPAE